MKTPVGLGSIYKITNLKNGKIYVGQTINSIQERFIDHISFANRPSSTTHFAYAIRKHGRHVFSIEILETCLIEKLNKAETKWIKRLKSNTPSIGYNMSEGGDGGRNSLSEEVRKKISATKKGVSTGPCSEERRKNISKAKLAKHYKHSAKTLDLIKQKRRAYKLTKKHKANISKGLNKTKTFVLSMKQYKRVLILMNKLSDSVLATRFNVSRKMIWRIRNGKYNRDK